MHGPHRGAADFERRLGPGKAEACDPVAEILFAEADRAEAAVASAAPPADAVRLQNMCGHAVVAGQIVGAGEAGVTAAYDGYVGIEIAVHGIAARHLIA